MKRPFLCCLLFIGLMGAPAFASAFRIDLSGMFSTSSTADRDANRPIEANREDSDDDGGSVAAPVTPESVASTEVEAGIQLHEELDPFGEYYDEPAILAQAQSVIESLRAEANGSYAQRTGVCVWDGDSLVCHDLAKLNKIFPDRHDDYVDEIESAFWDFASRVVSDPRSEEALYDWFLSQAGQVDCADLPGARPTSIMLGNNIGGVVYSALGGALSGELICGNNHSLDVGGLGQDMMGMVGGSLFDSKYQNDFNNAYRDCVAEQEENRGNPSNQLEDSGGGEQGADKTETGCKKNEDLAVCKKRLEDEKKQAEEEARKLKRPQRKPKRI